MQIVRAEYFKKKDNSFRSFIRNTSCSRGWLRVTVQVFFCALIVISFVLIVLMALGNSNRGINRAHSKCSIDKCKVTCEQTPFYGDNEDTIVDTVTEASIDCESIVLKLNEPTFTNSRLPENWLSGISSNVKKLIIIGGNIKRISPYAFMGRIGSNLRSLIFSKIEINLWSGELLIGLPNLYELRIIDCILGQIKPQAIAPVEDSLRFLKIQSSHFWSPNNVTGSDYFSQLYDIDFSSNSFGSALNKNSFTKISRCRVLYLNSCKITSLGLGTFDYLEDIKTIYLHDNYLITIPIGLFDKIIPLEPKITLHNNFWYCGCNVRDLRNLFTNHILMVDPTCHFPDAVKGLTFSDFEGYCESILQSSNITVQKSIRSNESRVDFNQCQNQSSVIFTNGACHEKNYSNISFIHLVPYERNSCLLNRLNLTEMKSIFQTYYQSSITERNWIKPVFAVSSYPYSMIEITASAEQGYGILWYHSSCVYEVYCVNTIPRTLKVYNLNTTEYYTFCPFTLSGSVVTSKCVSYNLANFENLYRSSYKHNEDVILYVILSFGCLICGAISVFALIQRNPSLLKGNKRVIIVKHKSIEALILPPQLSNKNKLINEPNAMTKHVYEKQKIFLLTDNLDKLSSQNLMRSISMRSSESNEAGYISPLQPTEEQLTEWRSNQIIKQFNDSMTLDSGTISFSSAHDRDSLPYYFVPIHTNDKIYEVPKQH